MQTPPCLLLRGWSERTRLYPDCIQFSSSGELLELSYMSKYAIQVPVAY